jgi:protease-4
MRLVPTALVLLAAAALTGCSAPSFLVTPVTSSYELKEQVVEKGNSDKIAIIDVEGLLADVKTGGMFQPTENKLSLFTEELNKAEHDDDVKAVVLRVNSPGGTVTTADTMFQEIKRFKEKTHKPVVAVTLEVCASGAYYASCAADKIVVHPTSIVGSIGVIFETFDAADGLSYIGIYDRAVHSGTLKEMGTPFKHPTDLERHVMQEMVNEYFTRFERTVKENRPNVKEEPPAPPATQPSNYAGIFSGRVWSGQKAVELGLADQTGLLTDAIDLARQMAHAPKARAILYKRPYGYTGSIYANSTNPQPQANVLQLNLPGMQSLLPSGFYYLWQP